MLPEKLLVPSVAIFDAAVPSVFLVIVTLNASAARLLFSYANENASSMLMVAFTAVVCLSNVTPLSTSLTVLTPSPFVPQVTFFLISLFSTTDPPSFVLTT